MAQALGRKYEHNQMAAAKKPHRLQTTGSMHTNIRGTCTPTVIAVRCVCCACPGPVPTTTPGLKSQTHTAHSPQFSSYGTAQPSQYPSPNDLPFNSPLTFTVF
eukprot:NODE_1614_length_897_cov_61.613208_g1259_i0.p2 GENE.NODE_1614_length_897_cov_61.613208_g1259_i0~~NODE_1614_length_897_cov_61.613208_g1259_i0.p2  ORF type:complete len:103 (-),score=13.95 NODE_1614_length_897_cov_61.613208_g1259_i0:34-342(-)